MKLKNVSNFGDPITNPDGVGYILRFVYNYKLTLSTLNIENTQLISHEIPDLFHIVIEFPDSFHVNIE